MKSKKHISIAILSALLAVALLVPAPSFAQAGDELGRKLSKQVRIHRDTYGVPHVFAKTDAGAIFGLMYAQAEDNFPQLEEDAIRSLGRAAEVYGESRLAGDLRFRLFEAEKQAKAEYAQADARTKSLLDAYAAGVNWYLTTHAEVKPKLLTRFEPWFILAIERSGRMGGVARAGLRPNEMRIGTPAGEPAAQAIGADDLFAAVAAAEAADEGSNMWALRPERSASGHALLFINPHVGFFGGGQRYEAHLKSNEGLNVSGFAILGTAYIRSGFNEHLGWSHTNNYADTVDAYLLSFDDPARPRAYRYGNEYREVVEWSDEVRVKTDAGIETRRFTFRKSHYGPIIGEREGKAVAVRIAKFEENGQFMQRYAMNKARNLAEFQAALSRRTLTGSNTIYADRAGNIYYLHGNAVPRRSSQFDWTQPVDGSNPETEWQSYHEISELPYGLNPPDGYLQNCNSTPFLMTKSHNPPRERHPEYMAPEEDTPRAQISRRLLESKPRFTFEEWTRLAKDTTVFKAGTDIPLLVRGWEAAQGDNGARAERLRPMIDELREWDGRATTDSIPMTLFALSFRRLFGPPAREIPEAELPQRWVEALEQTAKTLEERFGTWRIAWGEVNRTQRPDSSGEAPFDDARPSLPVPGAQGQVGIAFVFNAPPRQDTKRNYGISGNSYVAVVEFGKEVRGHSIVTFGQSGDPASPHFFDQAPIYARGEFKPAWRSERDIKRNLTRSYCPGEKPR